MTLTGQEATTLGDTSPLSPSLASLNGRLYIAWKGDGNDFLNVMYSADNGTTFGNKFISNETSPQAPALCIHNGNLYITWKGDGNDFLGKLPRCRSPVTASLASQRRSSPATPVGSALRSLR
jgi:hypothetical protein